MPYPIKMGIPAVCPGLEPWPRTLSCPRPFAAVLLSTFFLGMWYYSTSLLDFADSLQDKHRVSIYITINLEVSIDSVKFITRTRRGLQGMCPLTCTGSAMARFWSTILIYWYCRFSGLPTLRWSSYTSRPQRIWRLERPCQEVHSLSPANRYRWYNIRLDSHFTNLLWCCV